MHDVSWAVPVLALMASVALPSPAVPQTELLEEYGPIRVGEASPSFAGWDLDGQLVTLDHLFPPRSADTQAVVISFFATWCGPCKEGLPTFQEFALQAQEPGVRVILVAVGEDAEVVTPFLEKLGVALPTITDPFGTISKKFGLGGQGAQGSLPRTFVLDRTQKVHCIIGAEGADLLDVLSREVADARGEG